MKAADNETEYKPWLHNVQSAGISKRKKAKPLTRQQKVRQQRALEKADVHVNKLERKIADSKARGKKLQGRSKDWDELNEETAPKKSNKGQEPVVDAAVVSTTTSEAQQMDSVRMPDLEEPWTALAAEADAAQTSPAAAAEEVDEVT